MRKYLIFLLTSIVVISVTLMIAVVKNRYQFDVNLNDTYYVFQLRDILIIQSMIFITPSVVYFTLMKLNRRVNNWIFSIHYIFTIIPFLIIPLIFKYPIKRYKPGMEYSSFNDGFIMNATLTMLVVLMVGVLVFILAVITSKQSLTNIK